MPPKSAGSAPVQIPVQPSRPTKDRTPVDHQLKQGQAPTPERKPARAKQEDKPTTDQPKETQVELQENPNAPTMGWYKVWRYNRNKKNGIADETGKYVKAPPLSKAEQALNEAKRKLLDAQAERQRQAEAARQAEAELQEAEQKALENQRELTDQAPRGTVAFINAKGGAATTITTVNCACVLASDAQAVTIVLDGNPAEGTSAARLGKDRHQTITAQQLDNELSTLSSFGEFIARARPNKYFVRCISAELDVDDDEEGESDDVDMNDQDNTLLNADRLNVLVPATQQNCEYLLIDTANVVDNKSSLKILSFCDVFVFTANAQLADTLRRLGTSMDRLRKKGFSRKVNDSVVVISNLPEGADLQDYRKFLNIVNLDNEVVKQRDHLFNGAFIAVHHDDELALDREVNLEAWQRQTHHDYVNVNGAWLEQLKAVQEENQGGSATNSSTVVRHLGNHAMNPNSTPPALTAMAGSNPGRKQP